VTPQTKATIALPFAMAAVIAILILFHKVPMLFVCLIAGIIFFSISAMVWTILCMLFEGKK
jgi:hypothetical protein